MNLLSHCMCYFLPQKWKFAWNVRSHCSCLDNKIASLMHSFQTTIRWLNCVHHSVYWPSFIHLLLSPFSLSSCCQSLRSKPLTGHSEGGQMMQRQTAWLHQIKRGVGQGLVQKEVANTTSQRDYEENHTNMPVPWIFVHELNFDLQAKIFYVLSCLLPKYCIIGNTWQNDHVVIFRSCFLFLRVFHDDCSWYTRLSTRRVALLPNFLYFLLQLQDRVSPSSLLVMVLLLVSFWASFHFMSSTFDVYVLDLLFVMIVSSIPS